MAAADDEGEEDNDENWYGNVGKNVQEEGEEGVGGGSGRGDKGRLSKEGSYRDMARESNRAT